MNQILDYTPNNNSSKSGKSDKVVRIFAILLIIFALILICVVGYGMFFNNNKEDVVNEITHAKISVEQDEEHAVIEVTHDKEISKLIYSWNTSSERIVSGKGKYMEETIDVPAGNNTLHVKVVDENGIETTYDEEMYSKQGVDIINPVIELNVTDDKKLKITVTDETALDFVTYRWNDSEEKEIYAEEGSKKIETEIEILRGENNLTIVAVDASQNTTTEKKSFTGLTKPVIVVTLSADGSSIDIKATHEKGIKSVAYKFNNVDYDVDIGEGTPNSIQFPQKLEIGYNRIIITVKSVDGIETTFDGECNYGGEQQ